MDTSYVLMPLALVVVISVLVVIPKLVLRNKKFKWTLEFLGFKNLIDTTDQSDHSVAIKLENADGAVATNNTIVDWDGVGIEVVNSKDLKIGQNHIESTKLNINKEN